MRQKLLRYFVIALPVIGALSGIALGLDHVDWPTKEYWTDRQELVLGLIVTAGLVPVIQSAISEFGAHRRSKALEREREIVTILNGCLVHIAKRAGARWEITGVQAFLLKGWWKRKRHARVAKTRMSSIPSSGVQWTRGKGVIGRCWKMKTGVVVRLDCPPFSGLATKTESEWNAVDAETRFGLSFADYQTLGRKYGTVIAAPIMNRQDIYVGCLTIDTPYGVTLNTTEALASLTANAAIVSNLLER